jgi:hypothetical protein
LSEGECHREVRKECHLGSPEYWERLCIGGPVNGEIPLFDTYGIIPGRARNRAERCLGRGPESLLNFFALTSPAWLIEIARALSKKSELA